MFVVRLFRFFVMALVVCGSVGCSPQNDSVVVYVSLDRQLAEPILKAFEADSHTQVLAVYDTEANKTTGIVNRLLSESARPRADIFWNNETAQMSRLADAGVVEKWGAPRNKDQIFGHADGENWAGFAARMRILLVHKSDSADLTKVASIEDLINPRWKGQTAIANPHFGTTGTHFAALLSAWGEDKFRQWLRDLRNNEVAVLPGNAQVKDAVAEGRYLFGLTDSDDANEALQEEKLVHIVVPDQGGSGIGAFLIPNAVALIKGGPHPEHAKQLVDYLLSAEVEQELAGAEGAQIPIRNKVAGPQIFPPLSEIKLMNATYDSIGKSYVRMLEIVDQEWHE